MMEMEEDFGGGEADAVAAPVLEVGDQPSKEFLELFSKLDSTISGELIEKAWKQYDTVGQQIVLEGNQHAWMACAFFTTVWQSSSFGRPEHCCSYSLSALLELCEISVLEFFDKLNSWADLILASRRLLDHVKRVQSNLAVAAVIYKKFLAIFRHVFVNVPPQKQSPQKKAKHYVSSTSLQKLSTPMLFEFLWLAFLALRKQFTTSQEDLLHSFHLLLCLFDHVFNALRDAGQQKHLQVAFVRSLSSRDLSPLEALCADFEGVTLDAKHLRAHWLTQRLQKLSEDGVIVGYDDQQQNLDEDEGAAGGTGGILVHFEENKKAFEQLYEEKLLIRSEVDERVFLGPVLADNALIFDPTYDDDAVSILRKFGSADQPQRMMNIDLMLKISTQKCLEKLAADKGSSKLIRPSAKSYIITPETVCPNTNITLVTDETKQSQKLSRMLADFKGIDDDLLVYLYDDCSENPRDFVAEQVTLFSQKLMVKLDAEHAKDATFDAEFYAEKSTRMVEIEHLFYYLLQRVVSHDRERAVSMGMEMQLDMGVIFHNREFLASVYICALELVLFAHQSARRFPASAELLELDAAPINFYKIFELVVRADTTLSKEAVRHLNKVEESVLDEFAWRTGSPLWKILDMSQSMESFGEPSSVPSSQVLARTAMAYVQRNIDLPPPIVIFFKKVYHLAAIRVTDLCERVRIMDDLTRHKVWTLFEHVFRMHARELLRDRNLDQLVMCVLYIIARVCCLDITFQQIIYHYRHQPQSSSRVYRKVLIGGDDADPQEKKQYGDLIEFYNKKFVGCVEEFVKLLHPSGSDTKENIVPLIPLPKLALNPLTPRKIVAERVNVIPMSQYTASIAPSLQQQQQSRLARGGGGRYDFHKSPSKDLRHINMMVSNGGGVPTATGFHDYMG